MPIIKNGVEIRSLDQWKTLAGPKRDDQWASGRSAMEVARAWLGASHEELPAEFAQTIATQPEFAAIEKWVAEPEVKLCFDDFPGEPRNSDLVVQVWDEFRTFLIAVEAKADEPFGELVGDTLAVAVDRHVENEDSNGVTRIQQLVKAVFGHRQNSDPPLKHIRYQLLTACAGTICEAERRGMTRAILLIHEFVTDRTVDKKHNANATDLNNFIARLSHGTVKAVETGRLYGPFVPPGAPLFSNKVDLFVGKAVRNLRKPPTQVE